MNRTTHSQIGVILMLVVLVVSLMMFQTSTSTFTAKYKVGDCVQPNYYRESWEKEMMVERIEEVGERSYRTSSFVNGNWHPTGFNKYFSDHRYLKSVVCPQ